MSPDPFSATTKKSGKKRSGNARLVGAVNTIENVAAPIFYMASFNSILKYHKNEIHNEIKFSISCVNII